MANLGNGDREDVGNAGVTLISGAVSNPTTANDDVITLSGVFLLSGDTTGRIDGLGQTTADRLVLTGSDLRNVTIAGIEETEVTNTSTTRVDADQVGNLGALLQLNNHLFNFSGGFLRALCQCPHFIGYYGKTPALLTGTGGFDGGI